MVSARDAGPVERDRAVQYTLPMTRPLFLPALVLLLLACGGAPPPRAEPASTSDAPRADDRTTDAADAPPRAPGADEDTGAVDAPPSGSPLADTLRAAEGEALLVAIEAATPAALEDALSALEPDTPAAGWVALRLGRLAAHRRDFRTATDLLSQATAAGGPPAKAARESLDRLAARQRVVPGRIGVLLPLSGPYAPIGQAALTAARMAVDGMQGVELVVGDTAGDADRAPRVVESLVLEKGVAAILGPVGAIESHAAARAAERLEVPIVVLSSRADLTRLGTFVFRHRLTRQAQARTIARHAVEELGLRTFAILYPDTDYGREMMQAFWQTVTRLGGEVRGAEGYSVNVNDVNEPIKKLVGRHHLEARTADPHWEALNRKSKDRALHVPPVVDFEALFIPDGGRRVRLILPFLAYWDVEVKNDPQLSPLQFTAKYGGDTPQLVQILGGSGFTDPRLIRQPPAQALNSVFVDAFWAESDDAAPFVELWMGEFGRPPPALAAHAFDATLLLADAARGRDDRAAVRRALLQSRPRRGIFGRTRVAGDGEVEFDLRVLTLDPAMGVVPHAPSRSEEGGYFDEDAPRN